MSKKWYKNITPNEFWVKYVQDSVELVISFYLAERVPVTDIDEVCWLTARDVCLEIGGLYDVEQQECFYKLIKEYMTDYIEKKGGYSKLKLYTAEEIDAMEEKLDAELSDWLEKHHKTFPGQRCQKKKNKSKQKDNIVYLHSKSDE